MQVLIQKVKISQITVGEIGVTWEVNDTSQAFDFFVDRSGSPEGPFETITPIAIRYATGLLTETLMMNLLTVKFIIKFVVLKVMKLLNQR